MNTMKKLMLTAIIVATPLFAFDLGNVIGKVVNEVSNEIKKIPNSVIEDNSTEKEISKDTKTSSTNINYDTSKNSTDNTQVSGTFDFDKSKNKDTKQKNEKEDPYKKMSKEEVDLFAYIVFNKYKSNIKRDIVIDWYFYRSATEHYEDIIKDEFQFADEMHRYSTIFDKESNKAKNYFNNKIFKEEILLKVEKYDFNKERFPIRLIDKEMTAYLRGSKFVGAGNGVASLRMINTKKTYLNIPKSKAREYVSGNKFYNRGGDRYIKGVFYYKIKNVDTHKPISYDELYMRRKWEIRHVIIDAEATKVDLRIPQTNELLKTITY